jgi:protein TonB
MLVKKYFFEHSKVIGLTSSLIFHLALLLTTFNTPKYESPEIIVPLGLKVIPAYEKNDEVIPLLPSKDKSVFEKKIADKPVPQKVVEKVREGKTDGKVMSLKDRYLYELKMHIERNKIYPKKARRLKHQGQVVVNFMIDAQGNFAELKVSKSSSFNTLDKGALELLKKISNFKPLPEELKISALNVTQAITFQMN